MLEKYNSTLPYWRNSIEIKDLIARKADIETILHTKLLRVLKQDGCGDEFLCSKSPVSVQ